MCLQALEQERSVDPVDGTSTLGIGSFQPVNRGLRFPKARVDVGKMVGGDVTLSAELVELVERAASLLDVAGHGVRLRDSVYVAWDAAIGGSTGGVRLARSTDHGATFTTVRIDDPRGPGRAIGAIPFVGPNGEVYVAWNDYAANTIAFNRSMDGGVTWDTPRVVASKRLPFDIAIPAEFNRGALVYPACDTDRSSGPHLGLSLIHI